MRDIPLTKTMRVPEDYELLQEEFARVMETGTAGQHDHRRFEYALALRAIKLHRAAQADDLRELHADTPEPHPQAPYHLLDVGGAGSPFAQICRTLPGDVRCTVIDPKVNVGIEDGSQPHAVDAVVSISVIEHVAHPTPFLRAIHQALAPGGLLFLTMDCWNRGEEPDTAHMSWMRHRIYNKRSWCALMTQLEEDLGFQRFGGVDLAYHGDHLYGSYSFCSLCVTKKEA